MSDESIRVLIAAGFFMLLLLLRLESEQFGAAEYDEPGRRRGTWTRLSWYAIGLTLLAAIYLVHPQPHDVLLLLVGHRSEALVYGAALAGLGTLVVAAFAWFRYGELRLPAARAYPGAALNAIGTAVIDEATFRGALLGTLISMNLPNGGAVLVATLAYVLTTRLAAPGRHRFMLVLSFGLGLLGGWATLATGGIGAAIIGHAGTSFALFVCTGHAGQVALAGLEPEEVARRQRPPEGWLDARRPAVAGRVGEPAGLKASGPSGYGDRSVPETARGSGAVHDAGRAAGRAAGALAAWVRSMARAAARAAVALAAWVRPRARAAARATGRAAVALAIWVRSVARAAARATARAAVALAAWVRSVARATARAAVALAAWVRPRARAAARATARAAVALAAWVRPKARAAARAASRAAGALAARVRSMGSGVARRTSGPHDR